MKCNKVKSWLSVNQTIVNNKKTNIQHNARKQSLAFKTATAKQVAGGSLWYGMIASSINSFQTVYDL